MFGVDIKAQVEKFMMSEEYDEIVADVISNKLALVLNHQDNQVSCDVYYGDWHVCTSNSINVPETKRRT
jgi:hypothetical protein